MQSLFSFVSPAIAFGLGMIFQGVYRLVPTLDRHGWKKLLGTFVVALFITGVSLTKSINRRDLSAQDFFLSFCLIFCGLLFFAFRRQILPKINELVLLSWNIGVWYIVLKNLGIYNWISIVLLVPTVFSFSIVFLSVKIDKVFQIALYVWFMIMSLIVTFTYFPWNSVRYGFKIQDFSSLEMFFLGMAMFYAFSYFMCLVALIPLPSKNSRKGEGLKEWKKHVDDVEHRYDEIQFHPAISFLVAALIIAALCVNYVLHFVSEIILLSILFGVTPILGETFHRLLPKTK